MDSSKLVKQQHEQTTLQWTRIQTINGEKVMHILIG